MNAPMKLLNASRQAWLAMMLTLPCAAQTQSDAAQPAPPPQVRQTVEAVSGQWVGSMTATLPGSRPEAFPWEMICHPAALGSGASCSMKGLASIGTIEEACLLAYDPEGKAVHFMCVTSMGEVHDHKGQWRSDHAIVFEPYKTSWQGQLVSEEVTFNFPGADHIRTSSVITTEKGSRMKFEFFGTRH